MPKKFWKGLIIGLLFVLPFWVGDLAFSTTYYMRADGTAANKEAATGPGSTQANCMTIATHDGEGDVYSGDDVFKLCDDGGIFRDQLDIQSSGTSGHPIIYEAESGDTPIISGADLYTSGWSDAGTEDDDNFDDNDISEWTTSGSVVGQNERLEITIASSGADYAYQVVTARSEYWHSYSLTINALSWGDATYIYLPGIQKSDGTYYIGPILHNSGVFYGCYQNDAGSQNAASSISFAVSGVYQILVHWKKASGIGADDGEVQIWINGVAAMNLTNVDNDTLADANLLLMGNWSMDGTTGSATLYQDESKMGTTPSGVNLWRVSEATAVYTAAFDDTFGTYQSSYGTIDAAYEHAWFGSNFYVYSTSDPATAYTSPGVEGGQRISCVQSNGQDYITIDGITFKLSNYWNILIEGASNNTIVENVTSQYAGICGYCIYNDTTGADHILQDSTLNYNNKHGASVYESTAADSGSENIFRRNTLSYNRWSGITFSGDYSIAEYNKIHNNGTVTLTETAIHVYGAGSDTDKGEHNIIRYNLIYDNIGYDEDGGGIELDVYCDHNDIYGNKVYNNDGPGICIFDATDSNIYNNISYGNCQNSSGALTEGGEIRLTSSVALDRTANINVKNNIGFATVASMYSVYVDAETCDNTGISINTNEWYRASGDWYFWNASGGATLATWNAFTGVGTDLNSDPKLTDAAGNDFTLKPGSPCRHGATYLSGYETKLRPNASWPFAVTTMDDILSIGAYGVYRGSAGM